MAERIEIKASPRQRAGKGGARAVRRDGKVPAIIYGEHQEPQPVALDANEVVRLVGRGKFLSTVFDLKLDGTTTQVIPRDVQLDPVKDLPVHVDFQRVGASSRIRVNVPVRFINEALSPGLKRGGVLNIVRHEIEVMCPPDRIPAQFDVNLEGLEIGRSVHISAVPLPEGVLPTIRDRDFTVATIAGAAAMKPEVEEGAPVAAEGAEPGEAAAAAPEAGAEGAKAPTGKEAAGKSEDKSEKGGKK